MRADNRKSSEDVTANKTRHKDSHAESSRSRLILGRVSTVGLLPQGIQTVNVPKRWRCVVPAERTGTGQVFMINVLDVS